MKDDATSFSFDINPMEHIIYRRDLRFHNVLEFKNSLIAKITATHAKALGKSLVGFIRSFGDFESVKISEKEVFSQEYIIEKLITIEKQLSKPPTQVICPSQFGGGSTQLNNRTVIAHFMTFPTEPRLHAALKNLPFVYGISVARREQYKDPSDTDTLVSYEIEYSGDSNLDIIFSTIAIYTAIIDTKQIR